MANLRQRSRVGVVADDCVRFDLLGGYFEVIPPRTEQRDHVAVVMEPFSNGATQFGVAALSILDLDPVRGGAQRALRLGRADEDVGQPVAVDVAERGHLRSRIIGTRNAAALAADRESRREAPELLSADARRLAAVVKAAPPDLRAARASLDGLIQLEQGLERVVKIVKTENRRVNCSNFFRKRSTTNMTALPKTLYD